MKPFVVTSTDPSNDILRQRSRPLDLFFSPKTVAVIGATENAGSVGRTILWNLISTPFGGTVYPVNPKRPSVLGIRAYPRIGDIPETVDLAVIVTPAPAVPALVEECVAKGVKAAVIISAGFKETGPAGVELERKILETARRGGMRIIGPNCLGVMMPTTGVNATFAGAMARPGNVCFLSQSGALGTAILDWSLKEQVGFSAFISVGSMLDVDWGDLIDYFGDDPKTQSIVIYMESIGDARSFLSAAREVALTKPIIVIKPGRTEAAAKAAASHTGSLTGSDDVLDVAFRRCGVLRVDQIAAIFYMAEVLAKQPRPKGPRLTIVTNAGGPGVLAADALIAGGGQMAGVSPETLESLNKFLPAPWSHGNPIDILGDADPERYAKAVEIAAKDPDSDGLLVILTPQAMTDPTKTAEGLKAHAKLGDKPLLASWMGGVAVAAGKDILNQAGVPTFRYPDTAVQAFNYMWRYDRSLRVLYETPMLPSDEKAGAPDRARAQELIQAARAAGRTLLTEHESKALLAAYRIPTVATAIASSEDEAVKQAEGQYPVVLKIHSETITHKTDVGGVKLNLKDASAVRDAYRAIEKSVNEKAGKGHFLGVTVQPMVARDGYEIILGSSLDPQFGPVLLFGSGGQLVEVYKDRALALPPLTSTFARRMMERTKVFTALQGVRGRKAVDLAALENLLVRFSQLVVEQPWIKEMDINPLLASADQLIALDARVVLHDPSMKEDDLPRPAIRPYPTQYMSQGTIKNGASVRFRPIRPEDEPLMVRFHETLSERTVRLRYGQPVQLSQRVTHERLVRVCFNDYDREIALVAETAGGAPAILAVGRITKDRDARAGEISILVSDPHQGQGLGAELIRRLIDVARGERLPKLRAVISVENESMQKICEKAGFHVRREACKPVVVAELDVPAAQPIGAP